MSVTVEQSGRRGNAEARDAEQERSIAFAAGERPKGGVQDGPRKRGTFFREGGWFFYSGWSAVRRVRSWTMTTSVRTTTTARWSMTTTAGSAGTTTNRVDAGSGRGRKTVLGRPPRPNRRIGPRPRPRRPRVQPGRARNDSATGLVIHWSVPDPEGISRDQVLPLRTTATFGRREGEPAACAVSMLAWLESFSMYRSRVGKGAESKGQANPALVNKLLKENLSS